MRPGRISAASSFSGWLVVMITMRLGQSTTPSSTFSSPARSSLSVVLDQPEEYLTAPPLPPLPSISEDIMARAMSVPSLPVLAPIRGPRPSPASEPESPSSPSLPSAAALPSIVISLVILVFFSWGALPSAFLASSSPPSVFSSVMVLLLALPSLEIVLVSFVSFTVVLPLVGAMPSPLAWPFLARECTILLAASTSSITKIKSLNPSLMGSSSPTTWKDWSNTMSMSSWLVLMRLSGTFTMLRPVACAMHLIRLVFPVPGGPWSSSPSLCG
mmetsp:Transcript_29959/g.54388  ORF Transcript_29959/g.54388 Transcript_29959/m.54388 type:complete len:272 (-) Transcript_29959:42-857(-)